MTQNVAAPGAETLTDADREVLRDSVRALLAQHPVLPRGDDHAISAHEVAAQWRRLAALGAASLGAEPDAGGLREILVLFEELGRASSPAPLLGAIVANMGLAAHRGERAVGALLDRLARGDIALAVAFASHDGDARAGSARVEEGAVPTITGQVSFAEGCIGASHAIVFTQAPAGIAVVDLQGDGVETVLLPGLAVPALAQLQFRSAACAFVAAAEESLRALVLAARLACAARAVGAIVRGFELAVENAKVRKQFGMFIGQFQALQHKLADGLISLDGARLTLQHAAEKHDEGRRAWQPFASAALAFTGPALRALAVQVHRAMGAIGYSEEHEAPRHFRRVHADLVRFGGTAAAREELAAFLLGSADGATAATASVLPPHDTGEAADAFRAQFRAWLQQHWTDAWRAKHVSLPFRMRGFDLEMSAQMGRDGWIGIGWPKKFGGQARTPAEQLAFISEIARSGCPNKAHNLGETVVAPALFLHGTEEQQQEWLSAIRRGERPMALGYSEAGAGSDLASLRTRAVQDGDEWVVDGEKMWSSNADKAEYLWLAVRTDPDAKKHHGISVFIVSLRTPGITIRPSLAMSGKTFSNVHFDNVRIPARNMIGGVNQGWKVITDALAAERVMIGGERVSHLEGAFGRLVEHVRRAEARGLPLSADRLVRDRIGALAADLEVARRFHVRNAALLEQGRVPVYEAAIGKVFTSELQERIGEAALDILGTGGLLSEGAAQAPLPEMEQLLRHSIMNMIGGGTNEIQRSIIAQQGLGLPR